MAFRFYTLLPLLLSVASATPYADNAPISGLSDTMEGMAGVENMDSALSVAATTSIINSSTSTVTQKVVSVVASASAMESAQQAPAAPAAPAIISHAQANSVIQAAVAKAVEIKMPSNIAVTDPYGHLVSFLRMDGAVLVSIDVAMKKAKTVAMFGGKYRSGDLYNATSPGGALYGIASTNNGLIFFGGGVPLKLNGTYVGALGVSGGTVEQDTTIASAAAASFK